MIDERAFGVDHPEVSVDVNNLGIVLRALGDLLGAKRAFERALAIDEKSFGPNHPRIGIRVSNLAGVMRARGDLTGRYSRRVTTHCCKSFLQTTRF
jgi:tetratricopeptide (TPR) repeat protein